MKEITEDYVSRETYKLLKEKGYDGEFKTCYDTEGYTCPAIHIYDAMKWLREIHGLHIYAFVGIDESYDADGVMADEWNFWTYHITTINGEIVYDAYDQFDVVEHQTCEEACEAAIRYCLENLI